MAKKLDLSKVSYLFLTGGSRGIGATIAIEAGRKLGKGSQVVLTARNSQGLEVTKSKILAINPDLKVSIYSMDLSRPSEAEMRKLLTETFPHNAEQAVIIHNAGSIGEPSKRATDHNDLDDLQAYFTMNVFSTVLLNNIFMEVTRSVERFVINITSKLGVCPYASFSMYCAAKATREMFFRVLAEEEKEDGRLTILNYAPGPVDTDMLRKADSEAYDPAFAAEVIACKEAGLVLTTEQTALKLIAILEKGGFNNADHVDYFDV